jgi:hypothetical protein
MSGATVGAWTVNASQIYRTEGGYSAYLHYSAAGDSYSPYALYIGSGGKFRVDYQGNCWIMALNVDGQWVDFTTAFKNAVSLWGNWDGMDFKVWARFYNNNALTCSKGLTASVKVSAISCGEGSFSGSYKCTCNFFVTTTINGSAKEWSLERAEATATYAYFDGWRAARAKIIPKDGNTSNSYINIPGSDPESADE